ncbi:unnamed protein product, partial [Rotaria socialis]
ALHSPMMNYTIAFVLESYFDYTPTILQILLKLIIGYDRNDSHRYHPNTL